MGARAHPVAGAAGKSPGTCSAWQDVAFQFMGPFSFSPHVTRNFAIRSSVTGPKHKLIANLLESRGTSRPMRSCVFAVYTMCMQTVSLPSSCQLPPSNAATVLQGAGGSAAVPPSVPCLVDGRAAGRAAGTLALDPGLAT